MHSSLIHQLDKISAIASGSKFRRLISNPFNYLIGIGYRELIYPIIGKPFNTSAKLFWGERLIVGLPSGVDMYILGAKADDSEIRLTKYLIRSLQSGHTFIDVGAHFGYYSNLAAYLVGTEGKVVACEPAKLAVGLLKQNVENNSITELHNSFVGSKSEEVCFYEFPTKYAEYNSFDIDQYRNTDWFDEDLVSESLHKSITLDDLLKGIKIDFIKIDVEGAEHEVLLGAQKTIQSNYPKIGMEYVHADRSNKTHRAAVDYLRELGYQSYLILNSGELEIVEDLDQSLNRRILESDNFIFIHSR